MSTTTTDATTTEPSIEGPPASAASERMEALGDGDLRWLVRRRFGRHRAHDVLEEPVLAAATVAVARRRIGYLPWVFGGAALLALAVLGIAGGELVLGGVLAAGMAALGGLFTWQATRVRDSHLEVLREHGSVPEPGTVADPSVEREASRNRWTYVAIFVVLAPIIIWANVGLDVDSTVIRGITVGVAVVAAGAVALVRHLRE